MTAPLEVMRTALLAAVTAAAPGRDAAEELCSACIGLFDVDEAAVSVIFDGTSRGTFGSSSDLGRRLDEHQFTYGEGPCLDAASRRRVVLVSELDSSPQRWPAFAGAALAEGIHAVFAIPISLDSRCVGALGLFRADPGPLRNLDVAGAVLAAGLAGSALAGTVEPTTLNEATPGGRAGWPETAADDEWPRLGQLDRIEVYQATGMIVAQLDVDADEASARLRAHAVATGQTASQVAWAILDRRLELDQDPHVARPRRSTDEQGDERGEPTP